MEKVKKLWTLVEGSVNEEYKNSKLLMKNKSKNCL